MPLHDHLGADQHIRFPLAELLQDLPVAFLAPGRVEIHAERADARKLLFKLLLDLLGADRDAADMGRAAGGAGLILRDLVAAVVADELPVQVPGQGNIAVRTPGHIAACAARDKAGISPPV